jgi:small multidrug resistance pump
MKAYFFLFLAIISEITATTFLKRAEGFTKLWPSLISIVGILLAFYFLSIAIKTVPIGTAYAIWSGVGIVFITVIAALLYKQIPDTAAIVGMFMIVAGVIVINLFSKSAIH